MWLKGLKIIIIFFQKGVISMCAQFYRLGKKKDACALEKDFYNIYIYIYIYMYVYMYIYNMEAWVLSM